MPEYVFHKKFSFLAESKKIYGADSGEHCQSVLTFHRSKTLKHLYLDILG